MAKERIITRTIITITANCMVADVQNGTIVFKKVNLDATWNTVEKAEKFLRKYPPFVPEKFVFVKVMDISESEQMYGITESDFMKYAKPINNRADFDSENSENSENSEK